MVNVGSAVAYLELDTTKFQQGMTGAYTGLKDFTNSSKSLGSELQAVGGKISDVGGKMTKFLTVPILGAATAAVKFGMDFEKALSEIQAVTGYTSEEMGKLERGIRDVALMTGKSVIQLGSDTKALVEAGGDINLVLEQMAHGGNLAIATNTDWAQTYDFLSAAMKTFKMEADATQEVVDSFAHVTTMTNLSLSQLADSYVNVGGNAANAGFAIHDVNSILIAMSEAGLKGGAAGTALNGVLRNLMTPTKAAAEELENLGIALYDSAGNSRDMFEIMSDLEAATINMTDEQRNRTNSIIFDGVSQKGWNMIANEGVESIREMAEELANASEGYDGMGRAAQLAGGLIDTTSGRIDKVKAQMLEMGLVIFNILLPYIEKIINAVLGLLQKFQDLSPEMQRNIIMIAGIVAVAGPMLMMFGKIVSVVGSVIGAIKGMSVAYTTAKLQLALFTASQGINTVTTIAQASALKGTEVVVALLSGKMKLVTAAQWLWNAALYANPVALVVVVIAALVAGLSALAIVLNKNNKATKELKENQEALIAKQEELNDAVKESKKAHEDNIISMESEIRVSRNLADEVYRLAEKEKLTAEEKKRLKESVDLLNESMGYQAVLIDEETGLLTKTREEMNKLIDARREEIKAIAARERAIEIARELSLVEDQYNEIAKQRIALEQAKADGLIKGGAANRQYEKSMRELEEAEKALDATTASLNDSFEAQMDKLSQVDDAMIAMAESSREAAEIHEDAWVDANDAIEMSFEEMEKRQKEIEKNMQDYTDTVADMFNKINEKAAGSTKEYLETLDHNYDASIRFTDNLATLIEKGLDEGLVQNFREKGLDAAGEVALWANATEEEIKLLNEKMARNIEEGLVASAMVMQQGGYDVIQGMITGWEQGMPMFENKVRENPEAIKKIIRAGYEMQSPSKVFFNFSKDMIQGGINGWVKTEPQLLEVVEETMENKKSMIESYFPLFMQAGSDLMTNFKDGAKPVMEIILDEIKAWAKEIETIMSNLVASINSVSTAARQVSGSHSAGLGRVPFDGYVAELHKDERVLTREETDRYERGENGGSGGDTFVFNSPKAIDPYEASKLLIQTKRELEFA